jgi:4-amino-4-deoxy-L-arabinose transferase-like glycosyltransferase
MTVTLESPTLAPIEREWMAPRVDEPTRKRSLSLTRAAWPWLVLIASGQALWALSPHRYNHTPFEDEGLYVYEGHRIIAHLLHGAHVTEYPGSYFSGAPGLYPVLAAIGDHFGGINGARFVSLVFAIVAMVGVYGIGSQLFGKTAGVLGAAAFSLNGSVIYLSHWATYDSTMMAFVALAAWLGIWSAKRNAMVLLPATAVLLSVAFMAKYAAAAYFPVVVALMAAAGWRDYRWLAVRRAISTLFLAITLTFATLCTIGRSMFGGIRSTTLSRHVLSYGSTHLMLQKVGLWVGPWLFLAAAGMVVLLVVRRTEARAIVVLAIGAVLGTAEQIHMHELTSFDKHVAFGLVFACPLIGGALGAVGAGLRRVPVRVAVRVVALATAVTLGAGWLQPSGWSNSKVLLTAWAQDGRLVPVLEHYYARFPNKHILGDAPSPERYAMRNIVKVGLWNDTYVLYYKNLVGLPAYRLAVQEDHFGIIYLTNGNNISRYVQHLIDSGLGNYALRAKVPRYIRGTQVGYWLVYTLQQPTNDG